MSTLGYQCLYKICNTFTPQIKGNHRAIYLILSAVQYCYIALFIRIISKVVYLLFDVKAVKPFIEGTLKSQGAKIIGLINKVVQYSLVMIYTRHGHYNKVV